MKRRVSRIAVVLLSVLMLIATGMPAFAQTSRGAVSGAVSDPTGAVVVGAFVTLTNIETSVTRTTTSGNEGLYRFEAVEPGSYAVKITARDLDESTQADVIVTANQTAQVVTQLKWSTEPTVYVTVESGPSFLPSPRSLHPASPQRVSRRSPARQTRAHRARHHRLIRKHKSIVSVS
jgi:carboxypeptidase family protein